MVPTYTYKEVFMSRISTLFLFASFVSTASFGYSPPPSLPVGPGSSSNVFIPDLGAGYSQSLNESDSRFVIGLIGKAGIGFVIPGGASGSASATATLFHSSGPGLPKTFAGVSGKKNDGSFAFSYASKEDELARVQSILVGGGAVVVKNPPPPGSSGWVDSLRAEVTCASGPALPSPACSIRVSHYVSLDESDARFVLGLIGKAQIASVVPYGESGSASMTARIYYVATVTDESPEAGVSGKKSDDSFASYQASNAEEISRIASILKASGVSVKDFTTTSTGRLVMREAEVSCASGPALYAPSCSVFVVH
jgi:hypothetical protein